MTCNRKPMPKGKLKRDGNDYPYRLADAPGVVNLPVQPGAF